MPRSARFAPIDLETYPHDLTVSQVCDYISEAGYVLEPRTLHRWIRIGMVPAHHPPKNREWRIRPETARALLVRIERQVKRSSAA